MKKIIIILLLSISGKCCLSAQINISADIKEKIHNYVNCVYTDKYISTLQGDKDCENYKLIKLDTISIDNPLSYDTLANCLKRYGYDATLANLTNKIRERNIEESDLVLFTDYLINTTDLGKFKIDKEFESKIRSKIIFWYFNQQKVDNSTSNSESEKKGEEYPKSSIENSSLPSWFWISIAFNILFLSFVIIGIIITIKSRNDSGKKGKEYSKTDSKNSNNKNIENKKLIDEIAKLKKEIEQLQNDKKGTTKQEQPIISEPTISSLPSNTVGFTREKSQERTYYAEIDIEQQCFKRITTQREKFSIYVIKEKDNTFSLIEDDGLREHTLEDSKNAHLREACNITGLYTRDKIIIINPGKVQQDTNGKWHIINKIIIEIK